MEKEKNALRQALPQDGTLEEREWMEQQIENLSEREQLVLSGIFKNSPPATMGECINSIHLLGYCDFHYGATDNRTLGEFVAKYIDEVPEPAMQYVDMDSLGRFYKSEFDGEYTEKGYLVLPGYEIPQKYDGTNLEDMENTNWSLRLRLCRKDDPQPVCLKLPDHEEVNGQPDERWIALDALGVPSLEECSLLGAECSLPGITVGADEYQSLEDLVWDGSNLGYALEERGQGDWNYRNRLQAAMRLENCTSLRHLLDICENLYNYEFKPLSAASAENGRKLMLESGALRDDTFTMDCFDFAAYAKDQLSAHGLIETEFGYIGSGSYEQAMGGPEQSM